MVNSTIRQRYTKRPLAARWRGRVPRAGSDSLRYVIVRQFIICVALLVIIGAIKSINISATNFVTNQVKYILNHNIELKNVFLYIDKLAADIRRSIASTTVDKTASTNNQNSIGVPASTDTQSSSITQTSIGAPETAVGRSTPDEAETSMYTDSVKVPSPLEDETKNKNSYEGEAKPAPKTAVLSAGSEDNLLRITDMLIPLEGTLSTLHKEKTEGVSGNRKIHNGIDINVDKDSSIRAALDGKITGTGSMPVYGSYIRIMHSNSLQTVYANCSNLSVVKGDTVKKGDIIGSIDVQGMSVGAHLHFEVWKDGKDADPLQYISVPAR